VYISVWQFGSVKVILKYYLKPKSDHKTCCDPRWYLGGVMAPPTVVTINFYLSESAPITAADMIDVGLIMKNVKDDLGCDY
jgi:hypothetical protein